MTTRVRVNPLVIWAPVSVALLVAAFVAWIGWPVGPAQLPEGASTVDVYLISDELSKPAERGQTDGWFGGLGLPWQPTGLVLLAAGAPERGNRSAVTGDWKGIGGRRGQGGYRRDRGLAEYRRLGAVAHPCDHGEQQQPGADQPRDRTRGGRSGHPDPSRHVGSLSAVRVAHPEMIGSHGCQPPHRRSEPGSDIGRRAGPSIDRTGDTMTQERTTAWHIYCSPPSSSSP
jgi:hypothetical protein